MLQFWKKSGSKEASKSNPPSPLRSPCSLDSPTLVNGDTGVANGSSGSPASLAHFEEDDSNQSEDTEWLQESRSRLSMSLAEVIADKGALGYFIQYLEARSAGALIRFYLDVECFRSAAQEDARTSHSLEKHAELKRNAGEILHSTSETVCNELQSGIPVIAKDNDMRTESTIHEGASVHCDAVRIFEKYLGPNAPLPVPIEEDVRNSVALALCRQGFLDPECFSPAQTVCHQIMEEEYFNEFLRSDFYCKHQIDVLTSGDIGLMDILHNQTSLSYFMEFMEQEGQRALLEFWLAAHHFFSQMREDGAPVDAEQAQSDAIVLYEKYFSLQATCPLGFSNKIRVQIEHNICSEDGPPSTCFSQPLKIVERFLHKNYLKPFLESQLYMKYLSELINTIQATRNGGSDCGSEVGERPSMNTNTLLAGGDSTLSRKILRNMEQQNLSIDSRQLYDPDSLWRRRHHSGLSFGRINELGRFETEVEPEPDKKSESRITRAMKKLVHMDEDKAKEEMAWQIAEMIVKDVTSLTLHDEAN
ncbi:A-kinase anchor protein 10, mitochondrial [Frankliniella fusca]|uniref:A-kinase anchor protein 10, mitochondrial n=1 Tax=Frankliniella fusca TaxID=407009 RepID=A0AAE1GWJ1_9NEOP|nr:A-kinase anchor protein 10, mitochondrial [Frankliniella fusca]